MIYRLLREIHHISNPHKYSTNRVCDRYKDPFTQKHKEKSARGFATKKEAQIAASSEESKILEGFEVNNNVTLERFLKEWLTAYKLPLLRKKYY